MADVTFTVDGKKLTARAGTLLIDACKNCRHRDSGVLLLSESFTAGGLPHVRGAH